MNLIKSVNKQDLKKYNGLFHHVLNLNIDLLTVEHLGKLQINVKENIL